MDVNEITKLAITWGPTVLFLLILIVGLILGFARGFRKSGILAIHALVALGICLTAYFIIVNNPNTDKMIVSTVNQIMGEGWLQTTMGVSSSCDSLKECLIEFIPKNQPYGDGLALIVRENGQYLGSLVNLAYHIVFAILFSVVYIVLVFLLYLIYFIFYPERRHKKKLRRQNATAKSTKKYKKRVLLGGLVGASRGLVSGLVCMSFLGAIFFILAGGTGTTTKNDEYDYDFGNNEINTVHSIYQNIGSYGNSGIFKVLNSLKNKDDIPYYLFAAELVLQGGDVSVDENLKSNIALTNELSSMVKFGRQTLDLLLKNDDEGIIKGIILNNSPDKDVLTELSKIMCKEGFQTSFDKIIDDFNANTYFVNLSLSLIDSVCRNIDQLNLDLSSDVTDVICLLFKPGYKSPYVDEDLNVETPAYINASAILNEHDSKHLIKALVRILGLDTEGKDDVQKVLTYSKGIVPSLKELKILGSDSKKMFNPVLERLYTYLVNRYVPKDAPEGENNNISIQAIRTELCNDPKQKELDWIDEIQNVLDLSVGAIEIADNVYTPGVNLETDYLDLVFNIFDKQYPTYSSNIENYHVIKDSLSSSSLLSKVMSETGMYKKLEESIVSLAPEAYLEKDISYVNEYDENGNVVKHGEVYNLLTAVEKTMQDSETYGVIKEATDGSLNTMTQQEMMGFVKRLATILTKKTEGSSPVDVLLDSSIASSLLSGIIISQKNDLKLYIPEDETVLKKVDGKFVNVIHKEQITYILDYVPELMDAVIPFMDPDKSKPDSNNIDLLISRLKPSIDSGLLNSMILEGTIVNYLEEPLLNSGAKDFITIPAEYMDGGKLRVSKWIETNEIETMINGLLKSELKLNDIMNATPETQQEVILNQVRRIGELEGSEDVSLRPITALLESKVLHASVSGILIQKEGEKPLIDGFTIVVPKESVSNDLVNKDEISTVIRNIPDVLDTVMPFITEGDAKFNDADSLIASLTAKTAVKPSIADNLLESQILGQTLALKLTEILTGAGIGDYIKLPADLLPTDSNYLYNWTNSTNNEIKNLLYAIPASGLSINTFMSGELTNDKIIGEVTKIGNQADTVLRDEVFGSRVLHKTVSNLLITFNSNGVEIVVPNPSRVSTDLTLVKVDELVDLLKAVPKLLSVDMTNQNELVKAIVKNADELLAIPSLLTTVVNYLNLNVFDSIAYDEINKPDGLIVIPAKLREDADKETKLMAYDPKTNSNLWQNEALSLIRSLDTMLGLSKLESFNLNDQAWMSKTLSDNIKLLNDPYVEGSADTKLKVIYNSTIMTSTLTHNLDKILEDESLSNGAAYNKLKADGIVPMAEMATLVDVAKELNLDLLSFNTDLLLNQLKTLNSDSIVKPGTSKSDLIYESNIAKILLTKQLDNILSTVLADKLDKIDVKETNEVFTGVFNYYKPAEIKELINMFNYLEIEDIQNPSFTELKLEAELKSIVANSTIIKSVLTGELQKIEQIVIPKSVLLNESYINETEINNVLDVLISKKDDLFGAPVGNKYNITNFKADNITIGLLKSLAKSTILSATAINAVNDMNSKGTLQGVTIPSEYSVTKSILVDSYNDTLWAKNNELGNLINALGVIAADTDNIDSLNEEKVLSAVDNLLVEDTEGVTNLHKAYSSVIIKASLTSVLDGVLTPDIVDPGVKEHELVKAEIPGTTAKAYKESELEAAISAIQKGLGITHISDFKNVETVKSKILSLTEESVGYLHASYVVWSALDKQIDTVVNSITDNKANQIGAKEAYGATGGDRYKVSEINQILKLFTDQGITSLDGISLTSLKLDGDLKNIVLGSNIIKTALTVQVEKLSGIIVPNDCYDTIYPFIGNTEINSLLDILITNRDALFGTAVDGKHDFTKFNTDNITFGILKSVSASMIFTTTAINQINSLSVGIVVPAEYKVTAEDLKTKYTLTLWSKNNEFENLVNSIGVFVNENDKLTAINTDTITNKVDNLLVQDAEGTTNLHKAYASVIVRASLANAIDGVLIDTIVPTAVRDHNLVKESLTASTKAYKETEVEAIIRALQQGLGITHISSFTDVNSVKTQILSLNDEKLGYLHSSYIIWSILSDQIDTVVNTLTKNNANNIGAKEVYKVTGGDRYKRNEVLALVNMLNHIGVTDIDAPSLDAIKLDNDFKTIVLSSNILMSALTEVLKGVPAIVIPGDAYNATYNIIISKTNIEALLNVLITNKDSLFGAATDGKYDVASFNTDGITLNLLGSLITSNILHATAIKAIASMGIAGVTIPLEYQAASNSFAVFNENVWVKNNEITNLINALGVFVNDANAPIKNAFDASTIKNSVDSLLTVKDGVTNLSRIYTSVLAKASLTTALDGILVESIVSHTIRDHELVKENLTATSKCYKETEVEAIVRALKEGLGIENIASFNDATVVKNAIIGLTSENIKLLNKSVIVWSMLSTQLNNVVEGINVNEIVLNNAKEKLGSKNDIIVYKEAEVEALLTAIKTLAPELANIVDFNATVVSKNILSLTREDIQNKINPSSIVWSVLSDKFGTILGTFAIDAAVDAAAKYELCTGYRAYRAAEVANLLQAIKALAPTIDDITKFNVAMVTKNLLAISEDDLVNKVYPSIILWNILTVELDKAFATVNNNIKLNAKQELVPGYNGYKQNEVYGIILALNDLGLTGMDNVSSLDIAVLDTNKVSLAYGRSDIIKDYITKKLDTIIEGASVIVNHPDAKVSKSFGSENVSFYKVEELEALLGFTKSLGGSLGGFTLGELDLNNSTIVGYIKASAILNATFTKKLADSKAFIMPDSVFGGSDNKLLKLEDLDAFINSLKALGVKVDNPTANGITPSSLLANKPKFDIITNSVIIRATITDKIIKAAAGNKLYMLAADRDINTVNTNEIYVLKSVAIYSFINAINKTGGSGNEFGLSLTVDGIKSLSPELIYEACESTIARGLISNMILGSGLYATKVPKSTPFFNPNINIVVDKFGNTGVYTLDLVGGNYILHKEKPVVLDELTNLANRNVTVNQIEATDVVALVELIKLLP